jgi:hypothetical protein
LAIILQAYLGISDDEVIEEMVMDQRWQLALHNCGMLQGVGVAQLWYATGSLYQETKIFCLGISTVLYFK